MDETVSYHFATVKQRRENRHEIDYQLTLRQQPKQSRMCGVGEKADRRPIDPPPIVQLKVIDSNLSVAEKISYLQNPYYFMYASLMAADLDEELHLLRDGKTRSTTGSVVSSLYHLKDIDNTDAGFFVFPDLSVRMEGSYRLKLSLFEIIGKEVFHCRSIISNKFFVYSAKKFPGMEESTFLSRSFADQGLKIRIRKELRQRRKLSKMSDTEDSHHEGNTTKNNNNTSRSPLSTTGTSTSRRAHGPSGKRARVVQNNEDTLRQPAMQLPPPRPSLNFVTFGSSHSSNSKQSNNWIANSPPPPSAAAHMMDHNNNRLQQQQQQQEEDLVSNSSSSRNNSVPAAQSTYYNSSNTTLYQQPDRYTSSSPDITMSNAPPPNSYSSYHPSSNSHPPPTRLGQISYYYQQQNYPSPPQPQPNISAIPPLPSTHQLPLSSSSSSPSSCSSSSSSHQPPPSHY